MSNFTVCKEILPPSGVSHSCTAYFTHSSRPYKGGPLATPNIIIVRATLLQIYTVKVGRGGLEVRTASDIEAARLELVSEMRLAGTVESLAVLRGRIASRQRDALLLTFREAKLVVLDWDAKSDAIATTSMHYFEGDLDLLHGHTVFPLPPRVITDPQGRCAAVVMFRKEVALLPAMGLETLDLLVDKRSAARSGLPTTVGNSYYLSLRQLNIIDIRDAVFLHQYTEPVLLLLHEVAATWAGRYRERKDTMQLTALSINVSGKRQPVLWKAEGLPSTAFRLLAVPSGGALVLCRDLILFHTQGASCGLGVAKTVHPGPPPARMELDSMRELPSTTAARHARQYASSAHPEAVASAGVHAPLAEDFDLDLTDSTSCWISEVTLLLGVATGQLVLVNLDRHGSRVTAIRASKAGIAPRASGLSVIDGDLLFLSSWVGDSLLIRMIPEGKDKELLPLEGAEEEDAADDGEDQVMLEVGGSGSTEAVKRLRLDSAYSGLGDREDEDEHELSLIYESMDPTRVTSAIGGFTKFNFKVLDSLLGIAPVRDMVAPAGAAAAGKTQGAGTQGGTTQALVAACGFQRSGALAVLRRSLLPEIITDVNIVGIRAMWALYHRAEGVSVSEERSVHSFLVLGTASSTKVLEGGEALTEVKKGQSDFLQDRPTLLAANLCRSSRIVQVTSALIVLLAGASEVQKLTLAEVLGEARPKTRVVAASASDPYLFLHLSDGTAVLMQADETNGLQVVEEAVEDLQKGLADADAKITAGSLHVDPHGWLAGTQDLDSGPSQFLLLCRSRRLSIISLPSLTLLSAYLNVVDGPPGSSPPRMS
eukprot:jgi/Botrbrau1/11073/Bobra.0302s0015.1